MEYRKADFDDLPVIMEIVEQAKEFMHSQGLDQWPDKVYPLEIDFREDIERGECCVLTEDGTVQAVFTLSAVPEECYKAIYDGSWLTEGEDYAVIHRSAVSSVCRGKGAGKKLMAVSEALARELGRKSIRVDTHADNAPMRGLLERCGYKCCGVVHLAGPDEPRMFRVAYEKII